MDESKAKRIIVATTVGAVLLVVILLSVMIYQLISMSVKNNQIRQLELKISEYNQLIAEGEETKEIRSMRWWIEREARELGYVFADDKNFD